MKYLRKYRLRVGTPDRNQFSNIEGLSLPSNAVEITDLQIEFEITKSDNSAKDLNTAEITIKNASESTKRLIEKEDSVLILEAGWEDDTFGIVFQGDIVTYSHMRNGTDWDTKVSCADGYVAIREGITHKQYPPGSKLRDILVDLITKNGTGVYYGNAALNAAVSPPAGLGIAIGQMIGDALDIRFENGYSVAKPTKQAIDDLCKAFKLKWSIQDLKAYITDPLTDIAEKYTVPLVSEETGLIDSPERIQESAGKRKNDKTPSKGYRFTCTLNHEIIPEIFIKIQSQDVDTVAKVKKVKHRGSFEGNSWDTEVECIVQEV